MENWKWKVSICHSELVSESLRNRCWNKFSMTATTSFWTRFRIYCVSVKQIQDSEAKNLFLRESWTVNRESNFTSLRGANLRTDDTKLVRIAKNRSRQGRSPVGEVSWAWSKFKTAKRRSNPEKGSGLPRKSSIFSQWRWLSVILRL